MVRLKNLIEKKNAYRSCYYFNFRDFYYCAGWQTLKIDVPPTITKLLPLYRLWIVAKTFNKPEESGPTIVRLHFAYFGHTIGQIESPLTEKGKTLRSFFRRFANQATHTYTRSMRKKIYNKPKLRCYNEVAPCGEGGDEEGRKINGSYVQIFNRCDSESQRKI